MTALVVCLAVGGVLIGVGFCIGVDWAENRPDAQVFVLPRTHPSHHHCPAHQVRSAHTSQRPSLRLVPRPFDYDSQEPA